MVELDESATERRRSFALLHFTLVIATSYLLLAQTGFAEVPRAVAGLIFLALVSNVAMFRIPAAWVDSLAFTGSVLVADTVWITVCLLWSDAFGPEIFYIYFFLLFLAAVGENLRLIALGAVIVAFAYAYGISTVGGAESFLRPASMIRIPFLFAVAIFYGYLVERVRRERRRSQAGQEEVRQLDEVRKGLEQVNEELTRLNQMKSDFVSTVSHELKTPLTSIKNSLSLLRGDKAGPLTATQVRFLEMAQRNADRLSSIIEDILDLSKIEAGKLSFRFARVGIGHLLRQVQAAFEPQANAAGIELRLALDDQLPEVWADSGRLDQVLGNLVSNALKFTPAGGVVTLSATAALDGLEIAIADSGIGIPREDQERVFEPFFQSRDSLTNKARGTGLGLGIARDLVRAHGGDLVLESEPGKGTRLSFRLPAWSPGVEEAAEFEVAVREYSQFPYFSLLAVQVGPSPAPPHEELQELLGTIRGLLPRALDLFTVQPAERRILVALLGTARSGAEIVRGRLEKALNEAARDRPGGPWAKARVLGPACYPDDGHSARELLARLAPGRSNGRSS